jgi:hypothetical protein
MASGIPGADAVGEAAAVHESVLEDALGAFEGVFQTTDPVSLGRTFLGAMARSARRPVKSWWRAPTSRCSPSPSSPTGARPTLGSCSSSTTSSGAKDVRFRSPAWHDNSRTTA